MNLSTKILLAATAMGVVAVPANAQMRRNIRVVGSSTVYPFTKAVSERFARANSRPGRAPGQSCSAPVSAPSIPIFSMPRAA